MFAVMQHIMQVHQRQLILVVVEYTYGMNTLPVHEKTSLVDEKALDQLVEMGFDRRKATKALLVNR